MRITDRLKHAWNVLRNKDPTWSWRDAGPSYAYRPDRYRYTRGNERSVITAVFNRIAMDAAQIDLMHVRLDEDGRYTETVGSGLNRCLQLEANMDQGHRAFLQDVVASMLDEGVVAIIPTDMDDGAEDEAKGRDILTMRTGRIVAWHPKHVRVNVYNERNGQQEELVLPKDMVCIIENPFYAIVNEPNSTIQRLIRKLNLLDTVDEKANSGRLDLIFQLPYLVKTEQKRTQIEERMKSIEEQLTGSKYGIAYADASERVIQLNRPVENNLMGQVEYLTGLAFSQLGVTQEIMNGTADAKTMMNYYSRTIEPIISAIATEMTRKFLTEEDREKRETVTFFRDPFRLVPVNDIAEIADKFTRNEIMSSNELRQVIGMRPSKDPRADELRNKNLSEPGGAARYIQDEPKETSQNDE